MPITVRELIVELYKYRSDCVVEVVVEPRTTGDYQESYEITTECVKPSEEGEHCIEIRV